MNGHGGKREGAGRKPRATVPVLSDDPQAFLTAVMKGEIIPSMAQLDAAKTLVKVTTATTGKKEQQGKAAEDAAKGRFAPKAPPKLVAVR